MPWSKMIDLATVRSRAIRVWSIEEPEAGLDRLLVVDPHVLEEADVDLGRWGVVAGVGDQPADHPGDQGGGDEDDDDVDGTLPPRQHDNIVGVDARCRGDLGRLVRHLGSLPTRIHRLLRCASDIGGTTPGRQRSGKISGEWGAEPVTLVDVQEVTVRFGGIVALDSLTFGIEAGHICGLIGPNGAGKTTMFNVVSRIYEPTSGRVTYDGKDLLAVPAHGIAALGIARTFQNLALFPSMSLLENVMVGAHSQGDVGVGQSDQPDRRGCREQARPATSPATCSPSSTSVR